MPRDEEPFRWLSPEHRSYGAVIVSVGALCAMLSSAGQSFLLALYVDPLLEATNQSRSALAWQYGGCTLAAAALLPMLGRLADRWSPRQFLGTAVLLLGGALALLGTAQTAFAVMIAFFLLRLLGQGAMGLGTLTMTVRWFERRRARALSVVSLGNAAGEMVLPALILTLTAAVGWRGSLLVLAGLYVVLAPLVAWLARARPARRSTAGSPGQGAVHLTSVGGAEFTVTEAMRVPVFWIALGTVLIMPLVVTGMVFHQVALFARTGWATELVIAAFFAYAVGGVAAALLAGLVLDRAQPAWGIIIGALLGMGATGMMLAPLPAPVATLCYGALLGGASGFTGLANAVLWPRFFGVSALGAIKGVVNAVRNGATAAGAPLVALLLLPGSAFTPMAGVAALLLLMLLGGVYLRSVGAPAAFHGGGAMATKAA